MLRRPVDEGLWLTFAEAAGYVGKDLGTLRNWLVRGVLPDTDRRVANRHLYLEADLERVMAAPRRVLYRYDDLAIWINTQHDNDGPHAA